MNARKLVLLVVIFVAASAAWQVLSQTIVGRTSSADSTLGRDVSRMFGPKLTQDAPFLEGDEPRPPERTAIDCRFEHENRYRGLVWFSVFSVHFDASYRFVGPGDFRMPLPAGANIDGLVAEAGGRELAVENGDIVGKLPEGPVDVTVQYVSTGQDSWRYDPGERNLRDFRLAARTNFAAIDYPPDGLSPTVAARATGGGREAVWSYSRMLPARNRAIGIVMPARPAAGEIAARLAQFAPVSLFFFLTVMVTIQLVRNLALHPMNYLLIAAGFFGFHILLAYLVDHVTIHLAFWISAAVSVFLVVSYLRLVLGTKRAILIAGCAQMVYLVLFSYAFFWEGWTGLTVVIGALITLFVIMQMTGRIEWERKLAAPAPVAEAT